MRCRCCREEKDEEEMCELPQTIVMCEVCSEMFDASELCWECYWLSYPLLRCAGCLKPLEDCSTDEPPLG